MSFDNTEEAYFLLERGSELCVVQWGTCAKGMD